MPKNKYSSKGIKHGRSIEEVIVMRKLVEGADPNSWPTVDQKGAEIRRPMRDQTSSVSTEKLMSASAPMYGFPLHSRESFANSASSQITTIPTTLMPPKPYGNASRAAKSISVGKTNEAKEEIIKSLADYCKNLQNKLEEVESEKQNLLALINRGNDSSYNNSRVGSATGFQFASAPKIRSGSPESRGQGTGAASAKFRRRSDATRATEKSGVMQDHISLDGGSSVSTLLDIGLHKYENSHANNNNNYGLKSSSSSSSSQIDRTVEDLNQTITHLKQLFKNKDPVEERLRAIIKIQSRIRGYLIRSHYYSFHQAVKSWKWSRCGPLVRLFEGGLQLAVQQEAKIRKMAMARDMRQKHQIFSKWEHIVRQSAPMRKAMRAAAEEKGAAKDLILVRHVFIALFDACIGRHSNKFARKERRQLIEQIRQNLSEEELKKGHTGIVTEKMITQELHRLVLAKHLQKRADQIRLEVFQTIKGINDRSKVNLKKALQQRFKTIAGKCFFAWSNWIYMVSIGLDRKRWAGPRKYEVRYNQKAIDTFSKNRLQRTVFFPWKRFAYQRSEAERRFRNKLATFLMRHLVAWKAKADELRRLRIETVSNWRGYSNLMMSGPFQSWVKHAETAQTKRIHQDRLVKTYIRWKTRQKIALIMRTWRHQAVYGRVEGMYTRNMLSRSLGEQKLLSTSLQRMLTMQTVELEECRELVSREIETRKAVEQKLLQKDQEILKYEMVNDHRDQELRRLEAIIEAMAIINPRQIQHLKDMQLEFKFKRRMFDHSNPDALTGGSLNAEDDYDMDDFDEDPMADKLYDSDSVEKGSLASSTGGNSGPNRRDSNLSANSSITGTPVGGYGMNRRRSQVSHDTRRRSQRNSHLGDRDANSLEERLTQEAQNQYVSTLTDADRGLLLRSKWLVEIFSQRQTTEDRRRSEMMAEARIAQWYNTRNSGESEVDEVTSNKNEETGGANGETSEKAEGVVATTVPTDAAAAAAVPTINEKDFEEVGRMLLALLAFLEKGDTQLMSSQDLKNWTAHIMKNIRSQDTGTAASTLTTNDNRKEIEGSWRDVLINLRTQYPSGQVEKLEVGLSTRISKMRSSLSDVMRAKTAKQLKRGEQIEGLVLDATKEDEGPNVYAANISNLVKEVQRRMSIEDAQLAKSKGK